MLIPSVQFRRNFSSCSLLELSQLAVYSCEHLFRVGGPQSVDCVWGVFLSHEFWCGPSLVFESLSSCIAQILQSFSWLLQSRFMFWVYVLLHLPLRNSAERTQIMIPPLYFTVGTTRVTNAVLLMADVYAVSSFHIVKSHRCQRALLNGILRKRVSCPRCWSTFHL